MLNRFIAKVAIAFATLLIALIAGVIAVAFFAYAVYLALLSVLVASAAAAVTGVIVLAGAILLVGLLRLIFRPRRSRRGMEIPSMEQVEGAAEVGSELGRRLRGIAAAHASGGLLAALVAGFAVGVSPKLRAFLQAILKP